MNSSYLFTHQPVFDMQHDDPSKDPLFLSNHDFTFLDEIDEERVTLTKIDPPPGFFVSTHESLNTLADKIFSQPNVELIKKERDDAIAKQWDLEEELRKTRAELKTCREDLESERDRHEKQLAFLLYEYLPSAGVKIAEHSPLGPVDHKLVENYARAGDYIIGDFLGEGFYADVFTGAHLKTKKKYAIKCLKKEKLRSPHQMHQLEQELMVLKHVNHPNIIQLEDVLHAPNNIYLVLELGDKDLYTYARMVGITENNLREIMLGIVKPLQHLHSNGICHMDIKPENMLVMKDVPPHELGREHIKLADFGLCTISPSMTDDVVEQSNLKGTPGFFAPEMVFIRKTKNTFDARPADMWSVACTLLELTEGSPEGWHEAYDVYTEDAVGFVKGIRDCVDMLQDRDYFADAHVFDVVRRLLKLDPTQRLTASQLLEHSWFDDCFGQDGSDWSLVGRSSL